MADDSDSEKQNVSAVFAFLDPLNVLYYIIYG